MTYTRPNIETIGILNVPDVIHIGYELIDYIARDIVRITKDDVSSYVVITDENIAPLYLNRLSSSIQSNLTEAKRVLECVIMPGELSKSRYVKASIEDYLLDNFCTRDTCLIAMGGGVIGDLVGFVASTFMRGIRFAQIPTTLLAMVDSSIGGKTAIDTPHGKNLIGTFWQPIRIYIDLSMLKTLPKREFANGMAEVIKTAAISSEQEFMKLETGKQIQSFFNCAEDEPDLVAESQDLLMSVISASVRFKANVVTRDEKEGGLRGLLNFGHTFGHAYERVLFPDWLHGECVSIGLLHEAELSFSLGHCSQRLIERIENCLRLYDLPTQLPMEVKEKLSISKVMKIMKVDKKNKGSQKRVVLLKNLGEPLEQKASDVTDTSVSVLLSKYIENDVVAKSSQIIVTKPLLPTTITIVALDPSHIDLLIQLSQTMSETFSLIQIKSNKDKIKLVSTNSDKKIHIYITSMAGSNVTHKTRKHEYEYVVLPEKSDNQVITDILGFIDNITHQSNRHIAPCSDKCSAFITPTLAKYNNVLSHVFKKWIENVDAVEFRVDLLQTFSDKDEDWITTAGTQLFYLRQLTSLPIIFTVRTIPQAGQFDPSLQPTYYKLIEWAHRWGCDYIDIEFTTLAPEQLDKLMQFSLLYTSTWIASFHDPEHLVTWSDKMMKHRYAQAAQLFRKFNHSGVIKLVGYAETFQDNLELETFRNQIDPKGNKPIIFINMGPNGKFSRVANRFLTPVTHPNLPRPAAPGQLSINQVNRIRKELDMLV